MAIPISEEKTHWIEKEDQKIDRLASTIKLIHHRHNFRVHQMTREEKMGNSSRSSSSRIPWMRPPNDRRSVQLFSISFDCFAASHHYFSSGIRKDGLILLKWMLRRLTESEWMWWVRKVLNYRIVGFVRGCQELNNIQTMTLIKFPLQLMSDGDHSQQIRSDVPWRFDEDNGKVTLFVNRIPSQQRMEIKTMMMRKQKNICRLDFLPLQYPPPPTTLEGQKLKIDQMLKRRFL